MCASLVSSGAEVSGLFWIWSVAVQGFRGVGFSVQGLGVGMPTISRNLPTDDDSSKVDNPAEIYHHHHHEHFRFFFFTRNLA